MLSIRETVTNEVIEALKNGLKPWVCPWKVNDRNRLPINFVSQKCYSGINALILWQQRFKGDFNSNTWLTFAQVKRLKGVVIKGAKGSPCFYYTLKKFKDKKSGEMIEAPVLTPYTVFNLDQVEGIEPVDKTDRTSCNPIKKGKELLEASKAKILFGSNQAFYNQETDQIVMPGRKAFRTSTDFYVTALHELVHWTGHATRLNRKMDERPEGSDYAFEELVAELGSAFLYADIGLQGNLQHVSHVEEWLKVLQHDEKAIFRAAALAAKAHRFLMDLLKSTDEK